MKKLIIAVVAILAAWTAATAQVTPYFGETPRVALSASIDIAKPSIEHSDIYPGYDNGLGFTVGALYNLPLGGHFFFEPSAEIYYHTWSEEHYYTVPQVSSNRDYNSAGIALPVQVGYRLTFADCGLSIATGLAPRFGVRGRAESKTKIEGVGVNALSHSLYGDLGTFHRAEIALPVSVTVDYGRWLFGVRLMLGLTNIHVKGDYIPKAHNRSVSLRVAYAL